VLVKVRISNRFSGLEKQIIKYFPNEDLCQNVAI
jgi:hypothetical protein